MSVSGFHTAQKRYDIDATEFFHELIKNAAENKSVTVKPSPDAVTAKEWDEIARSEEPTRTADFYEAMRKRDERAMKIKPSLNPELADRSTDCFLYDVGGTSTVTDQVIAGLEDLLKKLQ